MDVRMPDGTIITNVPEGTSQDELIAKLAAREAQLYGESESDAGIGENIFSGLRAGAAGMLESAALGGATLLDEENELKAREVIQRIGETAGGEGGDPESNLYKLSQGVGSIAAFLPTSLLGPAALPAAAAIAVGAGAGEASERARAAGISEEERASAALKGGATGTLDVLPLGRFASALKIPILGDMLNQLGPEVVTGFRNRVRNAMVSGGIEAAQEMTTNTLQNLIEQGYNPSQELIEGLGEAGAVGGGSGAIVQILVDMFVRGKGARTAPPNQDDIEADKAVQQLDMFDDEGGEAPPPGTQADMFGGPTTSAAETNMVSDLIAEWEKANPEADPAQREMFEGMVDPRQVPLFEEGDVSLAEDTDWQTAPAGAQGDLFGAVAMPQTAEQTELDSIEQALGDPEQAAEFIAQLKTAREKEAVADKQIPIDEQIELAQMEDTETAERTEKEEADSEARAASEAESAQLAKMAKVDPVDAHRRVVLDNVLEGNTAQNYFAVIKNYSDALALNNIAETAPTNEEVARIQRAINIQFAEPDTAVAETAKEPQATPQTELEVLVPEKKAKAAEPEQLTLEGIPGRNRAKQAAQPIVDEIEANGAIDNNKLTELGVAKAAPLRKRIAVDPTNAELVRSELTNYANNPKVPDQTKFKITKYLEGESPGQMEAFGERGGIKAKQAKGKQDAGDTAVEPERVGAGIEDNVLRGTERGGDTGGAVAPVVEEPVVEPVGQPEVVDDGAAAGELVTRAPLDEQYVVEEVEDGVWQYGKVADGVFEAEEGEFASETEAREEADTQATREAAPEPEPKVEATPEPEPKVEATPEPEQEVDDAIPLKMTKGAREVVEREAIPETELTAGEGSGANGQYTKKDVTEIAEAIAANKRIDEVTDRVIDGRKKAKVEKETAPADKEEARKEYENTSPVKTVVGKLKGITKEMLDKRWMYLDENISDPSELFDYMQLTSLRKTPPPYLDKGGHLKNALTEAQAANVYFSRHARPIDAVTEIVHDMVFDTPNFRAPPVEDMDAFGSGAISKQEWDYFRFTGEKSAYKAAAWINENLSDTLKAEFDKKFQKKLALAARISKADMMEESSPDQLSIDEQANALAARIREHHTQTKRIWDETAKAGDVKELTEAEIAEYAKTEGARETRKAAMLAEMTEQANKEDKIAASRRKAMYSGALSKGFLDAMELDTNALNATEAPMHPTARSLLREGNLSGALGVVAATTPNKLVGRFASGIVKNIGQTKVEVVDDLVNTSGVPVSGLFDPATNTIKVDSTADLSTHTLLHEASHAVVSATLANKSHPLTKQLTQVYESVKDQLGTYYGSQSVDEFVAEAMGNTRFQQELASLYTAKQGEIPAWRQVVQSIQNFFKQLVGRAGAPRTYNEFNTLIESLMAPAPESRFAGELNMMSVLGKGSNLLQSMADATKDTYLAGGRDANNTTFNEYADYWVSALAHDVPRLVKRGFYGFMSSQMMSDISTKAGLDGTFKIHQTFENQEADISNTHTSLDATIKQIESWGAANPDTLPIFDNITHDSTIAQVDPSKPRSAYDGDKAKQWDEFQADWKALGKDGQKHYRDLRDTYRSLYLNMKENINNKIDAVTGDESMRKSLKSKVFDKLFNEADIEPYFPLTRSGKFMLQYNVQLANSLEPVVESFHTAPERARVIRELKERGDVDNDSIESFTTDLKRQHFEKAPPTSFVFDMMKTLDKTMEGVNYDKRAEVKEELTKLFLDTLPESSFMRAMQKRQNRLGYQTSATHAFRLKAYDISRQSIGIKYSDKLRKMMADLEEKSVNIDDTVRTPLIEEWRSRVDFATNPPSDWRATVSRTANRLAFMGTIGFNLSSAAVNLTQIPMMVLPYMAGKTNLDVASSSLRKGYSLLRTAGLNHQVETLSEDGDVVETSSYAPSIDNYYVLGTDGQLTMREDLDLPKEKLRLIEEIRPLVQRAADHGLLNRSIYYDTLGAEMGGKHKNAWDRVSAMSAWAFHSAERVNRQVALVGTYLNEMHRLENNPMASRGEVGLTESQRKQRAIDNALYDTQMTNGGAVLPTAPRWAQKDIGRVAMMYKSFGIQMYYTQFRMWQQALKNESPEMRAEAKRQLVGLHLTGLVLSGVQGLTIYGIVAGMANAMLLDDDELDAETITRQYLGEGLYKGALNQATKVLGGEGVDIASRVGLSNLLVSTNRYNFNPSIEKSIVSTFGGPAYGYGSQVARGVADIMKGETERGVENILPSAFRNMYKATVRYPREGIRTRRGDPVLGDVSPGLLAAQVAGFAPAEYTLNQERNQVLKRIDRAVNEERTLLMRKLYTSLFMGDNAATDEILDGIMDFNDRHPVHSIDPKSLRSSLKKHMETSIKMYNGVLFSPKMSNTLQMMGDDWGDGSLWE